MLLACALLCLAASGTAALADSTNVDDATLRCVAFIDGDRGWVAGDLGTVLKTVDGGGSWQPLPSGTSVNLDAIGMFNSQRGLVIGGSYQPHTQIGIGTVLWTADGGNSWQPTETADLPPLRHLLIGAGGKCVAAGDWSPAYQSSVFVSRDGGQTWQPASSSLTTPMIGLAGTVDDYLALTDRGELLRIRGDQPPQTVLPADSQRTTVAAHEQLVWVGHSAAAAGQLASVDFGDSWQTVAADPQLTVVGQTQLHGDGRWSLAPASSRLYRAARFSSAHSATPISDVPIRSLYRLDSARGWAVGDWGTIALTRDGGETWRTVRGGNRAAAVMVVAASGDQLPWSLLGMEALQNRRRVAIVTHADEPLTRDVATRQLGATAMYSVASADPATATTRVHEAGVSWPSLPDHGAPLQQLLAGTQPQVIVLEQRLTAAEKSAWTQAAIAAGVTRVFETGRSTGQMQSPAAALTQVGKLAGDVWDDALMVLRPGTLPPDQLRLSPRYDAANDRLSIDGLASFVGTNPRYVRPTSTSASRRHVQILQARMGEAGWIAAVLQSPLPIDQLMQQVEGQVARSSDENQQRLVWRLLLTAQAADKPMVFLGLLELAADRWPDQPLGRLCQLYRDATQHSQEWQSFNLSEQYLAKSKSASAAVQANLVQVSPFQSLATASAVTTAGGLASDAQSGMAMGATLQASGSDLGFGRQRMSGLTTIQLASAHESASRRPQRPSWDSHPAVRQLTQKLQAVQTETRPDQSEGRSVQAGDSNRWLSSAAMSPAAATATMVTQRPMLDGHLDEPIWQVTHRYPLEDGSLATLCVAHDDDFVYFGVRGQPLLTAGERADATTAERNRDQRLVDGDRYTLRIDVDGDPVTAYELEFNALGQTRDTYNGFSQWQPTWFFAHQNHPHEMVVEIAIKKSDLVGWQTSVSAPWNVSLSRSRAGYPSSPFSLPNPAQWCPVHFQ